MKLACSWESGVKESHKDGRMPFCDNQDPKGVAGFVIFYCYFPSTQHL